VGQHNQAVELREQLSRRDTAAALTMAAEAIHARAAEGYNAAPAITAARPRWRLTDRLGEVVLRALVEDRRAGLTMMALAQKYDISLSSAKRLLKQPSQETELPQTS